MELQLPGQYGERLITTQQILEISTNDMRRFQEELEKIAVRDRLAVTIEKKVGRGYMVQWAPVDEPWPW